MLIRLAEELDTTVGGLLGETVVPDEAEDIKTLSEKLEQLNGQFAKQNEKRRKRWRWLFIVIGIAAGLFLAGELVVWIGSQAMKHSIEESTAIIGGAVGPTRILIADTVNPIGEWIVALLAAAVSVVGIYRTRRR